MRRAPAYLPCYRRQWRPQRRLGDSCPAISRLSLSALPVPSLFVESYVTSFARNCVFKPMPSSRGYRHVRLRQRTADFRSYSTLLYAIRRPTQVDVEYVNGHLMTSHNEDNHEEDDASI